MTNKQNKLKTKYKLYIKDFDVTPFVLTRVCRSMFVAAKKYISYDVKNFFEFTSEGFWWYAEESTFHKAAQELVEVLISKPTHYKEFNNQLRKDIETTKEFGTTLYNKNIDKETEKELLEYFIVCAELYEESFARGVMPAVADAGEPLLTNALKKLLEEHSSNFESDFITLTTPQTLSSLQKEELNLLQLALDKNIKNNSPELYNHHKEYFWLTHGYEGPVYMPKDMWNKIVDLRESIDESKHRLMELENYEKNMSLAIENTYKSLKLDKKKRTIFDIAREWLLLKDARKEAYFACYAGMDKVAGRAAKLIGTEKKLVKYLTMKEFKIALFDNILPKNLSERTKHSVYFYANGTDVAYTGEECEIFLADNKPISKNIEGSIELTGQTAYKGYVKGTAKLIKTPKDMKKMNDGDILVSPATNPNLLPAMKKASAFVTDVGGITCHAAIVAREMKKPCVIGTKNATEVLHDGDLVEVNANHAVVRKI